ncbi:hypothetical protein QBC38DRAFT_531519 [Podospora fimiseda]|uniref:Nitrogen regulatory protein areA GATA-like domain-containing protein n=1 Tax=Podospora fimiseda TaxID=252190 RepID=A0AAN7BWI8_9PEZI|nr:hypothetical protein QBC38DRAFT_531519 [Podospora fimiseda]
MAVVLSSEESYFSSSTLRRSHSQPKFPTKTANFHTSASTSRLADLYTESTKSVSDSSVSTPPSSPRAAHTESDSHSCSSAPSFSLDSDSFMASFTSEDEIVFPQYDNGSYFDVVEEPAPSPVSGYAYSSQSPPTGQDESTSTSRPGTPEYCERAEDDIALKAQPSRHVDYLSHNWREEDIWSSWKHIVSRRGDYSNSARLENASWRTWMKAKNNLSTVSPETLNWLKDCDVTWLYGPLQTGQSTMNPTSRDSNSRLSKSNSFSKKKKPILKKRSMSEIMLQRSLSTSSLVKQAAASVQAQQNGGLKRIGRRPGLERATTDYVTFPFSSRGVSHDGTSLFPSTRSSGVTSPYSERKHIHFNEQVSQCIAVEIKEDDDDDYEDRYHYNNDSDSDDDAIMMKKTVTKKKRPILKRSRSHTGATESKTIAMLPSTTLKYRQDTPEPTETAMKHSTSAFKSPVMSPSSSQETLRPAKKSGKLFFADDDDSDNDDQEDNNKDYNPVIAPTTTFAEGNFGMRRSSSTTGLSGEPAGIRRTGSGMFMPSDDREAASSNRGGLIGRVADTVNTARDIAFVFWNVGWRK